MTSTTYFQCLTAPLWPLPALTANMDYKSSPPPPYSVLDGTTSYPSSYSPSYSSLFDSFKQSLASLTMSPSKLDLEVMPFDDVDMYGAPDKE